MGIKRIGGGMAVNQITEGVIWKQLLYFFFPILFGTFFQQLYNTADAVIVGQFVGTQALAAVGGATGSLINFFVNLFVGLASGDVYKRQKQARAAARREQEQADRERRFALRVQRRKEKHRGR